MVIGRAEHPPNNAGRNDRVVRIAFVGFVSSALLTVLGFLLYALFSFRRRFIEMGMLRHGLSIQQTSLLAAELAFLVLLGIGVGTALGVFASRLFVPFLQIGASAQSQYPPFQIEIAWLSIAQIMSCSPCSLWERWLYSPRCW